LAFLDDSKLAKGSDEVIVSVRVLVVFPLSSSRLQGIRILLVVSRN
jgi:hypothetical protein